MNVLLVTIDSLRADRVLPQNGLTPQIDALAAADVHFPQTITHGHGTPVAFPAILTGTYPMLYGGCSRLSPDRPILARRLQNEGYETAAFTSNPHLFDKYGYEVGFDEFNQYQKTGENDDGHHSPLERIRLTVQPYLDNDSRLYDVARRIYYYLLTATDERPYAPADEINDHVIDWLDARDGDNPFFAWVHYMDVHYPFYQDEETLSEIGADPISTSEQRRVNRLMNEGPEELSERDVDTLTTLYDAETYFTDRELGRLLDALRERELYEDTLVIVTSDHGEAFGEHDGFGHYKALYEELVRVPLVIHVPGQQSRTVDSQVGLTDLAPTVLDYVGLEVSENISGESLQPLIQGDRSDRTDERHVIGHGDPLGVRTERWKYIWWNRDGDDPIDAELFDLQADPKETTDVSAVHPEVVKAFDEYLAAHVAHAEETADALHGTGETAVDAEIEDQLEALGYR
jgi:arylsulfatase A-like enzyme